MSYVTVIDGTNGTLTRESITYRLIDRGWPATTAGQTAGTAHATATPGVTFYVDGGGKAVTINGRVRGGQWFNSSTNAVVEGFQEATNAQVQAAEIKDILRGAMQSFDATPFGGDEPQRVRWYLRMCIAYLEASTSDAHYDAVKTAARADLNELAAYASDAWDALNTQAGLFEWSRADAAALPTASATAPTRTLGEIQAVNVAQSLR